MFASLLLANLVFSQKINRNVYYTEPQKHQLMEDIAQLRNNVAAYSQQQYQPIINKSEGSEKRITTAGYDAVFQYRFQKGWRGIRTEERLKAEKDNVYFEVEELVEETDWDVEAVVDEDQL